MVPSRAALPAAAAADSRGRYLVDVPWLRLPPTEVDIDATIAVCFHTDASPLDQLRAFFQAALLRSAIVAAVAEQGGDEGLSATSKRAQRSSVSSAVTSTAMPSALLVRANHSMALQDDSTMSSCSLIAALQRLPTTLARSLGPSSSARVPFQVLPPVCSLCLARQIWKSFWSAPWSRRPYASS